MRALALLVALALPAPAHAAGPASLYLGVGLLGGGSEHAGGGIDFDLGVEATLNYQFYTELPISNAIVRFPSPWVVGGFAQIEGVAFEHLRLAAGAQGGWQFVGLEAGMAWETGGDTHAGTAFVHLAPFISLAGILSVALRIDVPVASADGPPWGYDIGVILTIKGPIPLNGSYPRR